MDKSRFLVFDSGVGGINIFAALIKRFLSAEFYYLSDGENCPYGNKSLNELKELSLNMLLKYHVNDYDGVVIACNTLSTNLLNYFKSNLRVPVFGVFPPNDLEGKTLLLSTPATAKSRCVQALEKKYEVQALPNLAGEIEDNIFRLEKVVVPPLFKGDVDNVILGCTHYIFLKDKFQKIYPGARIFDGVDRLIGEMSEFFQKNEFFVTTFFEQLVVSCDHFLGACGSRNYAVFCTFFQKVVQMF